MIGLGRKTSHSPLQQLKIDPVRRTRPPYWLASSGGQRIFINIRGQYGIQKNIYIHPCLHHTPSMAAYKMIRLKFELACKSSIFIKCCQKVELPAALLTCFLCALPVFCVNVHHFSSNRVYWNFIFWAYQAVIFLIGCEDKWFVLPEHAITATSFASHSFNIWTFLHVSTRRCPGSPCSQNGCTAAVGQDSALHRTAVLYPLKRRTL